jgi:hypothetical protein
VPSHKEQSPKRTENVQEQVAARVAADWNGDDDYDDEDEEEQEIGI